MFTRVSANGLSKPLIVQAIKTVNKFNKYFGFCSNTYPRKALSCQFYLKIAETYIGQEFSDPDSRFLLISRLDTYKAVKLHTVDMNNGFFQDNEQLVEWVNNQALDDTVTCLGDGHDGIWNIISQFNPNGERREILDWYHLMENLHKVPGSLQRLVQARKYLWQGKIEQTIALFKDHTDQSSVNFINYLNKHRHRIVNYQYYQSEGICSIGSGAVESTVKQIDRRTQISGAQWNRKNVPQVLALRCAYLNGLLTV